MEMGKSPMRAAFDGSGEVAFTILAMTLSLVAVFIPVLFMGGVVGRLLHEFAVTIGVAILVSGFVSISLRRCSAAAFRSRSMRKHGWLYNATERGFDAWLRLYDYTLRGALRFRGDDGRFGGIARRDRVSLHGHSEGLPADEDLGRFQIQTTAAQGIAYPRWFATSSRSPTSSSATRTCSAR